MRSKSAIVAGRKRIVDFSILILEIRLRKVQYKQKSPVVKLQGF